MQIAVYGGSFNPPHVGHALVAAWLRWTRRVNSVWLVPAFEHAFSKDLAPFADRMRMCQALARLVDARVSPIESELAGPSYTWNTLCVLRDRHPEHRFRLVVGADILEQTDKWHRWEDISAEFDPIIVGRGGYPPVSGAPTFPEISSTDVRQKLSRREPIDHLVPAAVIDVLEGLYG